ncbi:hypothetical protein GGR39_003426 [Novosphingobium fluoreni]|uniref:Benenodin family lasso peptide n=1 Tax=Novosphingobium fluoreni TaxID=1391222 RepID=A0A7W6G046_9SPHN|nr:hypothetical protein [Novosphingobium fluoreni]MBB3941745.1 hypothetical protein [Novosphingobium fluoreni]
MTQETKTETDLIDLGSATAQTQGNGGAIVPDAPQPRQLTGMLVD